MKDLIVFSVGSNRYALDIENIQRIIQATELTNIPNVHELIDGMMSYEADVIKVLNFRKLIGLKRYKEELKTLFVNLKDAHQQWIDGLRHSIETGAKFTKTTDPHKCELGIWLDNFNSYDDRVSIIVKDLVQHHKTLHVLGHDALALYKTSKKEAKELLNTTIYDTFNHTMTNIDIFIDELESVANSLQKFIIYENKNENGNGSFAIKVDLIEDIAHIEEKNIMNSDDNHEVNEFLELDGVLDLDGVLINVIKTINIPSSKEL